MRHIKAANIIKLLVNAFPVLGGHLKPGKPGYKNENTKKLLLLAGVLIMFFLDTAVGKYVLPDDFTRDNSMPASHFLMMGLDGQKFFVEDYSLNNGNLQKIVRGLYYGNGTANNKKYIDFIGIITGIWFLTLCFTVFAPLSAGKTLKNRKIAICLAVLGCVMFTLLFEGRQTYE